MARKKLLHDSPPLTVSPSVASAIGLHEAIVLQQIHYWTQISEENGKNFEEGRHWVYRKYADWKDDFPFWGESTIRGIISRLKKEGLLLSDSFNKWKTDKTRWYAVNYDELDRRMKEYEKNHPPAKKKGKEKPTQAGEAGQADPPGQTG